MDDSRGRLAGFPVGSTGTDVSDSWQAAAVRTPDVPVPRQLVDVTILGLVINPATAPTEPFRRTDIGSPTRSTAVGEGAGTVHEDHRRTDGSPQLDSDALIRSHLDLVRRILGRVTAMYPRHVDREELWNAGALGRGWHVGAIRAAR